MSRSTPWSELSQRERENFRTFLHDHGIRVTVDEAREYYGNREKVEEDATEPLDDDGDLCPNCMGPITQEGLLLEGDAGFCPLCGEDLAEGGDPAELIEEVTVKLTPGQFGAVRKGAELTEMMPEEFCRDAIRGQVQALENVLREEYTS